MSTPLKVLHTSDWHLGKRLYRLERLPEQELFLKTLLGIIKDEGIHHLLVAGDVFDVPQPPHKALKLFYDFIAELIETTHCELWIIGGNHDSGNLIDATRALVNEQRIHLFGALRPDPNEHWCKLPIGNSGQHIDLCLLPYFRQYELAAWRDTAAHDGTEDWPTALLQRFLTTPPLGAGSQRIFVGHHLFGLYEAAGSEQALALSGLDSIPLDWLSQFNYAALGHIHKPQTLKKSNPLIRYCGSPLPMRFSETSPKGMELLSITENSLEHRTIPLPVFRPLISLNVTADNWREKLPTATLGQLPAAVEINLAINAPTPGLIEDIRKSAVNFELLNLVTAINASTESSQTDSWTNLLTLTPEELFTSFYLSKFPEEKQVPDDLAQDMRTLWAEARHASSES